MHATVSSKPSVAALAKEVLQLLTASCGADRLVGGAAKCVEGGNVARVKVAGLETLEALVESAESFCEARSNVKGLVQKVAQAVYESGKDKRVGTLGLKVLLKLRERNYEGTIGAILSLPNSYMARIKELARENDTDLNASISSFRIGNGTASKTKLKQVIAESPTSKRSPIKVNIIGNVVKVNEEVKETLSRRSLSKSPLKARAAGMLNGTPPKPTAKICKKCPLDLLLVVGRAYTPREVSIVLSEIFKALESNSAEFPWNKLMQPILRFVFNEAMFEPSGAFHSPAINLLRTLISLKADIISLHLHELLENMGKCYMLPKKMHVAVNSVCEMLGSKFTRSKVIRILSSMMLDKKPPVLQAFLRCLSVVVSTAKTHEIPIKSIIKPLFIVRGVLTTRQ